MSASNSNQILIAGGGLIGTAIAWKLARAGYAVVVRDGDDRTGAASSAGAGMLSPAAEADAASGGLRLGVESLRLYPAFIGELQQDTGIEIEFRNTGCLMLGEGPDFPRFLEPHRAAGLRVEPRGDGLFYPEDSLVVPPELLKALRCAAQKRGVRFVREQVAQLETTEFAAVVVSAGAWSSQIELTHAGGAIALPRSIPVKGHLLAFRLPPGTMTHFIRRGDIYVLQRGSGEVVVGSNEEKVGFEPRIEDEVCEDLHRSAAELLPELAELRPERRWTGFRPLQLGFGNGKDGSGKEGAERDGSGEVPASSPGPLMEQVAGTNIWLAYGHFRNGILLTPVTAKRVAGEIQAFLAT